MSDDADTSIANSAAVIAELFADSAAPRSPSRRQELIETRMQRILVLGSKATIAPNWGPVPKPFERLLSAMPGHVISELARDLDALLGGPGAQSSEQKIKCAIAYLRVAFSRGFRDRR